MRYKAKPIEMEAIRFDGYNWQDVRQFVRLRQVDVNHFVEAFDDARIWWTDVPTGIVAVIWVEPSQQWAGVSVNDYICKDINGDFYPCTKDIFELKYEPVNETNVNVRIDGTITSRDFADRIQQSRRFNG